jgi:2-dehydro-3-deoxyglucarate aldolase/4-hydroxy-2-oxoheptanedioate aldolase
MTVDNHTLERLRADEPAFGAWALSMSPRVAEVLSASGLDWVGIDTEHSPIDSRRVESMVRAVEGGTATPVVRLPSVERAVDGGCKHALDAGARGLIVPGVESASEAERVVEAARFPPDGVRGVAGTTRANGYGERFGPYVAGANDALLLVVQIETPTAVERVEEIVAVDGVDVAFVGENDLSAAYGVPGEKDREEVTAAVDATLEAAREHGVHPGIGGRTPASMTERIGRGFRFFLLGADLTFARTGVEEFLAAAEGVER